MHGRIKVRTTEEEKIRKKKEQELKVKSYRAGMTKIYTKRSTGELDLDLYELTSKILIGNPDLATLWNIRREVILKLTTENEEHQALFARDLEYTAQCLRVQPKSYCAWHHRCWVLETSASPDWQKEVALCDLYLKLDERNFHCWDYRRYIVEKAEVPAEKELQFCTEKIEKNFSNYSSWHYRSKLLPKLFPHPTVNSRPISEEKLQEELVLVLNAAFTEPDDSSAWFYQRWLLGYSQPELDFAAFKLSLDTGEIIVAFTLPVTLGKPKSFNVGILNSQSLDNLEWESANNETHCTVWKSKLIEPFQPTEQTMHITLTFKDSIELKLKVVHNSNQIIGIKTPKFGYEFQAAVLDILRTQLHQCEELLELEPDSKWTLLTAALLMRAIDRDNENNHIRSLEIMEELQIIDKLRQGYYQDLASKWSIERELKKWIKNNKVDEQLNLSNLGLTCLYYEQYMSIVEKVDLSCNELNNQSLSRLKNLQSCKVLKLNGNNGITSLKNFPNIPNLEQVDFKNCQIPDEELLEYNITKLKA